MTGSDGGLRRWRRRPPGYAVRRELLVTLGLMCLLLAVNFAIRPAFLDPPYLAPTLAGFAPLALAACASTPSIMTGGIDISIGPLLGLVNVLIIVELAPSGLAAPWLLIPIILAVGAAIGLVNGCLVAVVRLPPVVATLGTYLVLTGLSLDLLPTPRGPAPGWIDRLGGNVGPVPGAVIVVGLAMLLWVLICRLPYHRALLAVGGNEPVAFSAGVNTAVVKVLAYALGGLLAGLAGLALTALIGSADATIGATYTLQAIAAVALGGTAMSGGRGGMSASLVGAAVIFLIYNALTLVGAPVAWLQLAYGAVLLASLMGGSALTALRRPMGSA